MARRSSGFLSAVAKDVARAQRAAEVARKREARETERAARQAERLRALSRKEAKQQYLEERQDEVTDRNNALSARIDELQSILEHTISIDDTISFDSLRIKTKYQPFKLAPDLNRPTEKPGWLGRVWPPLMKRFESAEAERHDKIRKAKSDHAEAEQTFLKKANQRNAEVDEFEAAYHRGDQSAIEMYNSMVLDRSTYPEEFPQAFRVAYVAESKQLVIDYELPTVSVIPAAAEYKYVKTKDLIEEKPRKSNEIKSLYQDIVAAVTLRTVHEVIEADQGQHMDVVVFSGSVQSVDPTTGQDIKPCLISLRVTRPTFTQINLARIEKLACLRNLGAQVSPRPAEMLAVKPIIEFDMVDKRFVEQSDVLRDLESRPNLMDLNPFEFETLVSNLFNKMGLESKLTRSSRDGGVDAVAFDTRPIVGGKVVIQAKRYKNTVGVSAVRDLYGTMMNEGANKGILVATSSYGPDAYDFAKDKPIELVDGGGLLYLLEQIGFKARIILPMAD
jgi:restriction system protein